MKPDGSAQEQVFNDEYNNWFPHISPDGKWMVFISFDKSVEGILLIRMWFAGDVFGRQKITVLAKLFWRTRHD